MSWAAGIETMPSPLVRAAAALASLALAARAQPGGVGGGSGLFNVAWPDDQPDGTDGYGLPNFAGAMPLGNGALTALAWANVSAGGVGIYLGHQRAQSTHTELLKLGLIQVALSPNTGAAAVSAASISTAAPSRRWVAAVSVCSAASRRRSAAFAASTAAAWAVSAARRASSAARALRAASAAPSGTSMPAIHKHPRPATWPNTLQMRMRRLRFGSASSTSVANTATATAMKARQERSRTALERRERDISPSLLSRCHGEVTVGR
jgi:hypothetical protein